MKGKRIKDDTKLETTISWKEVHNEEKLHQLSDV